MNSNTLAKWFPWLVVGVFVAYVGAKVYRETKAYTTRDFDLNAFAALPVLDGGRIKPLDSVARTDLLFISGQSEFQDQNGNMRPAIQWLLETVAAGDPYAAPAADYQIFRVDNEQLLAELRLEDRPGWYRYSWNELVRNEERFRKVYEAALKMDKKKRDLFHGKVLELAQRMVRYERLATGKSPTLIPTARGSEEWQSLAEVYDPFTIPGAMDAARKQAMGELEREFDRAGPGDVERLKEKISRRARQLLQQFGEEQRAKLSPAAGAFGAILTAYRDNKPKAFAEAVAAYRTGYVEPLNPTFRDTTALELDFNKASPFFYAAFLYVFAAVCAALAWLGWSGPFRKAAFGLAGVALVFHGAGLLGRMYLMGRPLVFVTNLYSSALLIGLAAVVGCLFLERIFRNGVGLVVGTTLGAACVKIAHHLSTDGNDTLGMLQAVLDTNFWLASHVTTITLGYAATYVAGLLGVVYILWGLFLTTLSKEKYVALGNMIYGVTCSALLLSFVGTVLGGIWADQSWGRFWGWDPKENGAVLIVIWNALVLHARWAGMVRQRGMAVLAVFGIAATTWSWFGTNQLGVGLHAYGFSETLAAGCRWTWIGCAMLIGIGLIPLPYWRSFAGTGLPRAEAAAAAPVAVATSVATPVAGAAPLPVTHQAAPAPKPGANGHVTGQPRPGKGKKPGKKR